MIALRVIGINAILGISNFLRGYASQMANDQ